MAAFSWKGSIKLGPTVQFPVVAKSAVRPKEIRFNRHHAGCGGRARAGQSICDGCGNELGAEDIVRGYDGKAGVDDTYLESLALDKTELMELDGLVPAMQIDPRYYAKSYTVEPQPGGERTYVFMLRLLEQHGKVAVGKIVMGGKETIVTVRPKDGVLAMEVMYWPEEMVSDVSARSAIEGIEVSAAELKLGGQLVTMLSRDFDPTIYRNEYAVAVEAYLERFVNGEEQPKLPAHKPQTTTAPQSLEEAIAASIRAMGGEVDKKKGKKVA